MIAAGILLGHSEETLKGLLWRIRNALWIRDT